MPKFQECASCAAKPGSPILCESCLNNRATISTLERANKPPHQKNIGKKLAWGWLALVALIGVTGIVRLLIDDVMARIVIGGMVGILLTIFCISYLEEQSR